MTTPVREKLIVWDWGIGPILPEGPQAMEALDGFLTDIHNRRVAMMQAGFTRPVRFNFMVPSVMASFVDSHRTRHGVDRQGNFKTHVGAQNVSWREDFSSGEDTPSLREDYSVPIPLLAASLANPFVAIGYPNPHESINRSLDKNAQNLTWAQKLLEYALQYGVSPVVTVGWHEYALEGSKVPSLKERLSEQLQSMFSFVDPQDFANAGGAIALKALMPYKRELLDTVELVSGFHTFMREALVDKCKMSKEVADTIPLVYGGQLSEVGARKMSEHSNIDGFLIDARPLIEDVDDVLTQHGADITESELFNYDPVNTTFMGAATMMNIASALASSTMISVV